MRVGIGRFTCIASSAAYYLNSHINYIADIASSAAYYLNSHINYIAVIYFFMGTKENCLPYNLT